MSSANAEWFPETQHSLDLDPCTVCSHCDFMTYSTEHLKDHMTNRHNGLEIKSETKVIPFIDSAKVRLADAWFHSKNVKKPIDSSFIKNEGPSNYLGSSNFTPTSNTEVSESKDDIKNIIPLATIFNQSSTDLLNFNPLPIGATGLGKVEYAKYLSKELQKLFHPDVKQELTVSSNWNPKVETFYCLSCPFNNVHLQNLRCHMYSFHPCTAAIARKSHNGDIGSSDPTAHWIFFCIKETCSHNSTLCTAFEEHLMTCCPSAENLSESEPQRLVSTLSFLLIFHKASRVVKALGGFYKYAYSLRNSLRSSTKTDRKTEKLQRNMIHQLIGTAEECEPMTGSAVLRRSLRRSQPVSYKEKADDDDEMYSEASGDEYRAQSPEEFSDESD